MFDQATLGIIPSARVVRVHMLRHGEVDGRRICRGQSDDPLSRLGEAQTARTAAWFRSAFPSPDRVIASDLSRCATLARALDPGAVLEPALREQHMGAWDGKTWEELTRADPAGVTAYWDDYVAARPPGGESYAECYARATRWWDAQDFGDARIVLVTHIGVLRALLCHWLDMGPDQALRWAPGYASHTAVSLAEAGCVVERFGEQAHLDGL